MTYSKFKLHVLKKTGLMPMPKKLTFEPTDICNLQCSMCERYITPSKKDREELKFDEIKQLANVLPKSIEFVYISGGEPLMRQDIKEICNVFLNRDIKVSLQTNGTFIKKTLELAKMNDLSLIFSLDGSSKIHDKIRGQKGVYKKNIQIYRFLKNNLQKNFIITSVITDENLKYLNEMFKTLGNEGLKPFMIIELARRFTKEVIDQTINALGLNLSDIPLHVKNSILPSYSYKDFKKNLTIIDNELKNGEFKFCYFPRDLFKKRKEYYFRTRRKSNTLCCSHLDVLRIDCKGNVIPCFVIRKSFGNIKNESIDKIWNSREFCKYRMNLIKNNLVSVCETCYRALDFSHYDIYLKNSNLWN